MEIYGRQCAGFGAALGKPLTKTGKARYNWCKGQAECGDRVRWLMGSPGRGCGAGRAGIVRF